MKFVVFVIFLINFVQLFSVFTARKHSWGEKVAYASYPIYEGVLIDERNDVPKNYTIIHKYVGSHYKKVVYYEINVNVKSSGYIHQSDEEEEPLRYDRKTQIIQIFDAKVRVNNAKNVTATLSIYVEGFSFPMNGWYRPHRGTKSLTYIYVKNALPTMNVKQFAQNSIGHRRQGDELIYFESRNVTNYKHFPSRSFEYSGSESNEYITYVGFSFNSPTTIAMINISYVGEQEFNAVVYDMSMETFIANMSIYGIKSVNRPPHFLGVI